MAKNFSTEIRKVFEKKYIKLFLLNMKDAGDIKIWLMSLPNVKKVNISNGGKDLTIYPSVMSEAEETETAVIVALNAFYSSTIDRFTN